MVNTTCAMRDCMSSSRIDKQLKFHQFPHSEDRCKLWVEACRRPDLTEKTCESLKNTYICSLHFEKKMYARKSLKKTATPTLLLPNKDSVHTQTDPEILDDALIDLTDTPNILEPNIQIRVFAGPSSQAAEDSDTTQYMDSGCEQTLPFIRTRTTQLYNYENNQDPNNEGIQCEPITNKGPEYTAKTQPLKRPSTALLNQYIKLHENNDKTRKRKSQEHEYMGKTQHMNFAAPVQAKITKTETQEDGQEKDDIDLFFDSLAKTVKRLPKLERIKLKWDIMKMVNEVETRCLESNTDIKAASNTGTITNIPITRSQPIAFTSPSLLVFSGQSLLKPTVEPSDKVSPLSPDRTTESIESDPLAEADTLTIMGTSESILNQNWPNLIQKGASLNTRATKEDPDSTSTSNSQTLPCRIVSTHSLTACKEAHEKNS